MNEFLNGENSKKDSTSYIDSYFQKHMIEKRNLRMTRRVNKLLKKHRNVSFFFAFGAGITSEQLNLFDSIRLFGNQSSHTRSMW